MNEITFEGKVFAGEGTGRKYLSFSWVQQQIKENLGFTPFLGTLNLKLNQEGAFRRKKLEKLDSLKICPPEGYCVGLLFKAYIGNNACAVIIPQVRGYPKNVLEIIASTNLRASLGLSDEDSVAVRVQA